MDTLNASLAKTRRIAILKKVPVLYGLDDTEYRAVVDACHVRQLWRDEVLFREGETGHELYVVLTGRIEISTRSAGVLHTMTPGELLGEMAVVRQEQRTATAQAVEDAALLRIDRSDLEILLGRAPRASYLIMKNIAHSLAQRLERANDRLARAATRRAV